MMKKREIASILTACAILAGTAATVPEMPEMVQLSVSAEDTYTEGTYERLTYRNYGEYIVITDCTPPENGSSFDVEVPAEIDGVPVTTIGESAFSHLDQIWAVTLPDTVTVIETKAFQGALVRELTLSKQLTAIGRAAFNKCTSLHSLELPDTLTSIGDSAFSHSGLTSITIPDSITMIPEGMFKNSQLQTIEFPENLTSIGELAFSGTKIESISIPDSVTELGSGIFYNTSSLTAAELPAGVTTLTSSLFSECYHLTTVSIPASVTEIQTSVFEGCDELAHIYFAGTQEEWNAIAISNYNEPVTAAEIHFSSAPDTSGGTVLYGDVNADGEVSIADVLCLNKNLLTGEELTDEGILNADVDLDGSPTSADAMNILKYTVKLLKDLPV